MIDPFLVSLLGTNPKFKIGCIFSFKIDLKMIDHILIIIRMNNLGDEIRIIEKIIAAITGNMFAGRRNINQLSILAYPIDPIIIKLRYHMISFFTFLNGLLIFFLASDVIDHPYHMPWFSKLIVQQRCFKIEPQNLILCVDT